MISIPNKNLIEKKYMKQCPTCFQNYDDTEYFCANDGSTLNVENSLSYIPFNDSEEIATQVISAPFKSQDVVQPKSDSAKWLYLIIGVLATSLLAVSIFLLIPSNKAPKSEKADETQKNSESANENIPNNSNPESVEQTTIMNVAPSAKSVSKKANKPNISTKASSRTVDGNTQFTSDEEPIRPMNSIPSIDRNAQFTTDVYTVPANANRPVKSANVNVKVVRNTSTNVKVAANYPAANRPVQPIRENTNVVRANSQ